MEHPVRDVRSVIRSLCQGSPQEQKDAVNRYYLPSASLVHPFCRVPSFELFKVPVLGLEVNSRDIILEIFKCPKVDLEIESAVFDQRSSLLYLTISQVFSVWFVPFYKAPVRLVTVLHLVPSNSQQHQQHQQHHSSNTNGRGNGTDHHNNNNTPNHIHHHLNGTDGDEPSYAEVASGSAHPSSSPNLNHRSPTNGSSSSSSSRSGGTRYLIQSQQDYYQVNEFLKFVLGIPGAYLWSVWQLFSTIVCILGAAIFSPLMNLSGLGAWLASSKGDPSSRISVSLPSLSLPGLRRNSEARDKDVTDGSPARQKAA